VYYPNDPEEIFLSGKANLPREEAVRHLAYIRKQDLLVENPTPIKTTNKIEHELSEKRTPKISAQRRVSRLTSYNF
jgi:hypothetical protein